ncbi:MAG TPA: bifunctional RNase H/acid phosphatase [Lapillicoccus sp.]|nr:bifunctional RNase H/acid phosphatase [Lapillicoccus sp.]
MADRRKPVRRLVVEADGGSRGNPGVAGYGAVVRDAETGTVLVERAAPLGRQTNNHAEYRGLIAGLEAAVALAPGADVEVRMDSQLVVEQMSGRWRTRHPDLRELGQQARDLVDRLGEVTWRWVPRDQNTVADRLSNVGMDGRTVDTLGEADPAEATAVGENPEPALEGATRLVLVRHAVTPFTEQGRVDGRGGADPDLSDAGREQAARAAEAVAALVEGEVRLVTSSLARARQTGAAMGARLGVEPLLDDDWDEQSFGDWDGAVFTELAEHQSDDLTRLWRDRDYRRPGGESLAELETRVLRAYEQALDVGGTTVVVTSRKPILVVLARVLGIDEERFWALSTDPASLTAVERWPDGRMSVPFVNRTSHLT